MQADCLRAFVRVGSIARSFDKTRHRSRSRRRRKASIRRQETPPPLWAVCYPPRSDRAHETSGPSGARRTPPERPAVHELMHRREQKCIGAPGERRTMIQSERCTGFHPHHRQEPGSSRKVGISQPTPQSPMDGPIRCSFKQPNEQKYSRRPSSATLTQSPDCPPSNPTPA